MADVKCVVCGEPWDFYGAQHGDMEKWEWRLFRAGAGCPSCEGHPPESGHFEFETVEDTEFGDLDPMERVSAMERSLEGRAPVWEKPKPKLLWACDACGIQSRKDANDDLEYHVPPSSNAARWHTPHPLQYQQPRHDGPAHIFEGGEAVCEFCLSQCGNCGRAVCPSIEFGDPYVDGWCTADDSGYGVICVDCVEHEDDEYEDDE